MKTRNVAIAACVIWLGCVTGAAGQPAAVAKDEMARQLDEIARIATAMVDGDACQRIVTKRAIEYAHKVDPKDPYAASDNYDVNDEPYNATKKTLVRLSRLASFPCDVNLWLPVEGKPGQIQVVIRNVHELSQFWRWGALSQDIPAPMKTVLETGKRVTAAVRPGWVSVLAPVYNSLGEIVGLVEAVAQERVNPQDNVK